MQGFVHFYCEKLGYLWTKMGPRRRRRRLYTCVFGPRLGPLQSQILDPALGFNRPPRGLKT